MSLRLKAASFAALALSAIAAVTATDRSVASEVTVPRATLATMVEPKPVPSTETPKVIFAAPREVVQPMVASHGSKTTNNEEGSVLSNAKSLAALVDSHGDANDVQGDLRCLAGAVYFESKGESLEGQLAVARVVINRSKSGRFANSLCGVVFQRGQFSFVRRNALPPIRETSRDWHEAVAIAKIAISDSWDSRAEGALFFHARHVSPSWGKARLASIDNHIFYR